MSENIKRPLKLTGQNIARILRKANKPVSGREHGEGFAWFPLSRRCPAFPWIDAGPIEQPVSGPAMCIYFVDGQWQNLKPGDPNYFLKSNGETVGIIHLLAMHYLVTIDMAECGRLDLVVKERS